MRTRCSGTNISHTGSTVRVKSLTRPQSWARRRFVAATAAAVIFFIHVVAPTHKRGLGVAYIEVRARALLDKQACPRLPAGGWPRAHLSYRIGLSLLRFLNDLRAGPHDETPPPCYADLAESLFKVFDLDFVRPNSLQAVTSASLCVQSPHPRAPPLKIQLRLPSFPWNRIWGHLSLASLTQPLTEVVFSFNSNIHPTGEGHHRFRLAPIPACDHCQAPMDNIFHIFTFSRRLFCRWRSEPNLPVPPPPSSQCLSYSSLSLKIILSLLNYGDVLIS